MHYSIFIQTLTRVLLSENQIGDQGAQFIAQALLNNTVRQCRPLHLFHSRRSLFIQTLKELFLHQNQIGDKSAQSIAQALLNNTVRQNLSLHLLLPPLLDYRTDTEYTRSLKQSNRISRSRISS